MDQIKLHQKLLSVQSELKAPKGQFNSFGKYKYRSAEDIMEAVKPICHKHGAVLTVSDELVFMGDRYYIKATASLWDTITGESISNTAYAREEETKKGMDASQITGTASSYARKYAMNGLFAIDDTKDADSDEFSKTVEVKEEPKISANQLKEIKKLFSEAQIPKLLERANVTKLEDLSVVQASDYIKKMQESRA